MTSDTDSTGGRVDAYAEWIITLAVLGIMSTAFLAARSWPPDAAMFPMVLSGLAIGLLILKLVFMVMAALVPPPATTEETPAADEADGGGDLDEPPPGAFATANGRAWGEALLCLVIFFTVLSLFGIVVTLVVFGIGYLKIVGHRSLIFGVIYVGVLMGAVHLLFVQLLSLPLPEGILFP
ncbi:tripartite tricarboxylate transporter TctB family protein [Roseisalinus antarcticus]|uniref:Tripartite tricarboxylate transporter TctB family protein n=1 Tax=Roseisalinus antarcticus TaxID=254357 RepID=A0A1Y5T786_9RHOB|nr:tripartite tricarboxylate transporter TctB family protein [Roseisalinus antarcticus]SLN57175.1 Tripartite tricarboxylate transporter TctB family protein [Roseisalinus antarcticus]